jgi:hypothetical protein
MGASGNYPKITENLRPITYITGSYGLNRLARSQKGKVPTKAIPTRITSTNVKTGRIGPAPSSPLMRMGVILI